MLFSYNWLKDYVKSLPAPDKLAVSLTMHFAEVEDIKKLAGDFVFDIDIRPNRAADCFSHLGIAREIAAIANLTLKMPSVKVPFLGAVKTTDLVEVIVQDKPACSRYTAKAVTDVKVGPSPKWLQDRLKACGMRPINNIVDAANYVMLETGQPLHAFDAEKLQGKKIIVRPAKKTEEIVTLDGDKFSLDPTILVIADEKKPVAIAGIKGGKDTEIDKQTKTIIIESANFNPLAIRRASKKINLRTDASVRFEHGLDPNLAEFALNRAASLMQKIAKGKAAKDMIDIYSQKVSPVQINLDLNYLNGLLGINIAKTRAAQILKKLGFKIIKQTKKYLLVEAPTSRSDVSLPEDLIEEIGRIVGYEQIPAVFPAASLIPAKRNDGLFWEDMVKDILKAVGFTEVYNYSFIADKDAGELVELQNPLSAEQKYLRPSLIPGLLTNAKKNAANFSSIKIFEIGKIFKKDKDIKEQKQLTALMTGTDFYQLKGIVDLLLEKLGISSVWYDDYQPTPEESKLELWHPQKRAEIKTDDGEIGFLGEILPIKAVVFDINFDKLVESVSGEHEYRPISKFPAVVRDLAILVPRKIKVEEVLNKINTAGGAIIRDVDLFDIYEGEEVPDDKKNLAFHIIYQSEEKTLTSAEVDLVQQKVIKALEKDPSWEVRK
ncbi:MAG: phenylalanine--tRNA ligase subunit beta [Candidatus Nealsonbacteria bacterium]|nr:phenylalanine--tRNA ligase subunit beta [Candidatus Nealsonbacteria bacterium]